MLMVDDGEAMTIPRMPAVQLMMTITMTTNANGEKDNDDNDD